MQSKEVISSCMGRAIRWEAFVWFKLHRVDQVWEGCAVIDEEAAMVDSGGGAIDLGRA